MNLTESQRAAVERRGSNLLVSASAGSGKTEVLARRCVSLIADPQHPCGVGQLLVVTFTRAAAVELRARVGQMLREAARDARDHRLRDHLRRQEVLLDTADIGTIDAWCARIAREHFAASGTGVDPAFTVLGQEQAALLRRATADELFEWVYGADDPLANAAREWIRRHARPSDDFLRELVLNLNRHREHLVNPGHWFEQQLRLHRRDEESIRTDAARLLSDALMTECKFQHEQLGGVVAAVTSPDVRAQLQAYREALEGWCTQLADAARITPVVAELSKFKFARKPRGVSERDDALREEVKERWFEKRLRKRWSSDGIDELLAGAGNTAELVVTLLRLERRYRGLLGAQKRERQGYEFGDVLRMALDLLGTPAAGPHREPTPIAQRLRRRYEHILVDEYQDTSPVQVELLRLVTRSEPGRSNRFMVGDVKQSIYGFREAEPRLFADLIDSFSQGREEGEALPLTDNFRSHPDLVEGLNRLFAGLFAPALGGTGYGEQERLHAKRDEIVNPTFDATPRTELHLVFEGASRAEESEEPIGAASEIPLEWIEREGQIAAGRIHTLLDAQVQIPERDADGAVALRPLRLADIVILLRSAKGNAPRLAGALRQAGIPCVAAGRESLLDSLEVQDVRNALTLLVNRQQDVALAGYLRGPMVGLSAVQLLEVRRASAGAGFYGALEACRESSTDRELVGRLDLAMRQLDRWAAAARTLELPVLLRRVLRETDYLAFAQALPGAEHRGAMLSALESLAVEFAARGRRGVAEFVEHLDALQQQDLRPAASATSGGDSVRIMTIHAAKGLEFPVVFLLGTGAAFSRRPQRGSLRCDEQCGMGIQFLDYPTRAKLVSAAFEVSSQALVQRELEEELRLLYVAATRAREHLVIVGHTPERTWSELCGRYAEGEGALPLISRLNARSMLEWVMMGVAASQLDRPQADATPFARAETYAGEVPRPKVKSATSDAEPPDAMALTSVDRRWIERGRASIENIPDTSLAQLAAVLSVSAVKEQATRAGGEDLPRDLDLAAALREPAFTREAAEEDGRIVGNAHHHFMQHADLKRLGSASDARAQVDQLVAERRLSAEEAELVSVDDVVWFANTDEGQLLARRAETCRREVPFVYALSVVSDAERTVLRGVIDCLVETEDGLLILDYKTDRVRGREAWKRRVDGYSLQMQLYALAAAAVFGREVTGAVLVFLRKRRVLPVRVDASALEGRLHDVLAGWRE